MATRLPVREFRKESKFNALAVQQVTGVLFVHVFEIAQRD